MIDKKQTLVINLIGGPCAGKSTIAAELFSRLKKMGVHCELVPEYIKELIYEENKTIPQNQIAIFGNQHYMINNKIGKVDCVIQDGSFLNNIIYVKLIELLKILKQKIKLYNLVVVTPLKTKSSSKKMELSS